METQYKSFNGIRKSFEKHPVWGSVIVVGILVLLVSMFSGSGSSGNQGSTYAASVPTSICDTDAQTLKQQAQKVSYKQLDKDPGSFSGTIATFTGQIVQIEQSGNEGIMRLSVTKESYGWSLSDIIYVTYHQATNAVDGDVVTVTGTLTGSQTYTSQANFQITIPSLDVCSVQMGVAKSVPAAPVKKTTTPTPAPQQTYTTPSGAVVGNSGNVVSQPPAPPASWHIVATYSGQTQKNTSTFVIQGSQWRITWQETGDGYFGADAESPDGSGSYCSIANLVGAGSDSTYCYKPGTYYLSVNTANPWTMTVEDYY